MKKRLIALFLALSLGLCACGSSVKSEDLMKNVSPRQVDVTAEDSSGLIAEFYVNLFKACAEEGENVLISPLSVYSALGLCLNGAQGDTLAQMEDVLGPVGAVNDSMHNHILSTLDSDQLHLANSIWLCEDDSFSANGDFLQKNADYYRADVFEAPFDKSTLEQLNAWTKEHTKGMIDSALDKLPEDAVMLLVNALAFEAKWASPYNEAQVRNDEVFTGEDGERLTVDYLIGSERLYLEDEMATGFMKLYEGGKYAFVALLPNEGVSVAEYVASLEGEALLEMLRNPRNENIIVSTKMPVFELRYQLALETILAEMGMELPFDPDRADLSGMGSSSAGNLYLSQVFHKTYINVSASGTRAAAVTTAVSTPASAPANPPEQKEVILDRPFVYMLIDFESGLPFFMGTMMAPRS